MWKTLTEVAQTWRHRESLISQWNKVNLSLLMRLIVILYGPSYKSATSNGKSYLNPMNRTLEP